MASKIEHIVKYDTYTDAYLWARGADYNSTLKWLREKADAHKTYLGELNGKKRPMFYATAPRSRFLNWLAHKLLVLAWGRNSYMALQIIGPTKADAPANDSIESEPADHPSAD